MSIAVDRFDHEACPDAVIGVGGWIDPSGRGHPRGAGGFSAVLVNGTIVYDRGKFVEGAHPGGAIRRD